MKKEAKVTLVCASRARPSKEAVSKFTELYLEIVNNIEIREPNGKSYISK